MMRKFLAVASFVLALSATPAALADCVNFSQARAERAAAELRRNAPTPASLGMPTLDGFELDALATTGDPVCSPGPITRYIYRTNFSLTDFVTLLYPNIRRRTETDGMQRVWFANPWHGDDVYLTSGTRLNTSGQTITNVTIYPATPVLALSAEQQPYSIQDIVTGSPWPGGASGPRAFVRADGAAPAQAATQRSGAPAAQTNCPTQTGQGAGAAAGAQAGAQAGAAIGGATRAGSAVGAAAGAVFGGILGARRTQPPAQQPGC